MTLKEYEKQLEEMFYDCEENCENNGKVASYIPALERVDPDLFANLRQLFIYHRRQVSLTDDQREEIVHRFQSGMEAGVAPMDVIARLAGASLHTADECRSCLYQAIWKRRLRVDLFKPIVLDRPLRPEERDVIDVQSDWFKE